MGEQELSVIFFVFVFVFVLFCFLAVVNCEVVTNSKLYDKLPI